MEAKDVLEAARKVAGKLTVEEIEAASARRLAWWSKFWEKSFIEIPDKEIERRWYATGLSSFGLVQPGGQSRPTPACGATGSPRIVRPGTAITT